MSTPVLPSGCVEQCPGCHHRRFDPEQSTNQKLDWICRAFTPWQDKVCRLEQAPANKR